MGKVLSEFLHGWPGAVTRSKDDVIVSLKKEYTMTFLPSSRTTFTSGSCLNIASISR